MNFILEQGQRAYGIFARFAARLAPISMGGRVAALLREAQTELAKRDFGKAAAAFREVLAIEPTHVAAHAGLTKTLLRLGDWPAATSAARAFVARAPSRPSAMRLLGQALYQADQLDDAERILAALLHVHDKDDETRVYLSRIALKRGRPDQALVQLDLLSARTRFDLQRRQLRGDALMQLSRLAEARDEYEAAHHLRPGQIEVLRRLGEVYGRLGLPALVERVLGEMYAIRPSDSAIGVRLARALLDRSAFEEAEAALAQALKRTPGNREVLTAWALVIAARRQRRNDLGEDGQVAGSSRLRDEALAQARNIGVADPNERVLEREIALLRKIEALAGARSAGLEPLHDAISSAQVSQGGIATVLRLEALEEARRAGIAPNGGLIDAESDLAALVRMEALAEARQAGIEPTGRAIAAESDLAALVKMEALAEARRVGIAESADPEAAAPAQQLQDDIVAVLRLEALAEARQAGIGPNGGTIVAELDLATLLRREALAEARRAGIAELVEPVATPIEQLQDDIAAALRLEALADARRVGIEEIGGVIAAESDLAALVRMEALAEARRVGIAEPADPAATPVEQLQDDISTVLRLEALADAARVGIEKNSGTIAAEPDLATLLRMEALAEARRAGIAEPADSVATPVQLQPDEFAAALRLEALAEARRAGIVMREDANESDGGLVGDEPTIAMPDKSPMETPRAETGREGTPEWLVEKIAEAIHAFRGDAFAEAVDSVDRLLPYDQQNVMALEIGGFAANRLANWPAAARFWGALSLAQPNRRGPHLQHATALLESGDTAGALATIDPLLAGEPQSAELIRLKLSVLTRSQDSIALDKFDTELRERAWTKSDTSLLETIGAGFLAAGNMAAARRWLEHTRSLDPENTASLRLQARIAYAERQYDIAVELCEELERSGNDSQKIEARMIRARIAHLQGNPAEAMGHYERVIAVVPDNIEAVTFLVRRHLAARQVAKAEERIAAVPRSGNEGTHHWWRALVLQAKGDVETAAADLLAALEASHSDMQFRQRVIEFLLETERHDAALKVIRDGLDIDPKSVRLRGRLLQCRMRMGCPPEEIVEICSKTLAINPRDEDALLQRSNANSRMGNRRAAIADFRFGLTAFPRNTTFWRSAVSSLLLLGEEGAAKELLEEAKAAFTASTAADLAALADIFDAADLQDQALAYAEAALVVDAQSQASLQLLARIQMQRGRFDLAWPHLLALQGSEQRHIRSTRLYAQAAAGRAAVGQKVEAADRVFPDAVFDAIVARQPAMVRDGAVAGRLRVLHVTSTLGAGGAERQLANTIVRLSHLRNAGIEAELAVEDLNPAHGRDFFLAPVRATGIPIYSLDEGRQAANWRDMLATRPEMRGAVLALSSMPPEIVRNALALLPILLDRRPDVVHLWQDSVCVASGIAAVLAGVPRIVLSTRSTRPVERQRARRYLEPGFRALLKRPGTSLLNNSRNGARDYEGWLELPGQSVEVIHNGYDFATIRGRVDDARSRQIRDELGIPADAPVLGGVMRCSFEKRPELWTEAAIELCRTMPEAYAILVGDGPMLGQIKSRVAECGLASRIHYVGSQSPVEPWMRAMSVLFLSSLTEGLPNVLIEAQSLGIAVATMRIGGAPETVIENETAAVIDDGPIEKIAEEIRELLADRQRREAYGERGVQWTAAQFSIEATVDKLLEHYRTGQDDGADPSRLLQARFDT